MSPKYITCLPQDVVKGHERLNLAFVANLFNMHPGLEPPAQVESTWWTTSGGRPWHLISFILPSSWDFCSGGGHRGNTGDQRGEGIRADLKYVDHPKDRPSHISKILAFDREYAHKHKRNIFGHWCAKKNFVGRKTAQRWLELCQKKSVPLTLMIKRSSDVPQLDELAWSAASCQLPLLRFHFPSLFPLFFNFPSWKCPVWTCSTQLSLSPVFTQFWHLSFSSDLGNGLVIFQVIFSTRICKTEVYMFWQIS